MKCKKLLCLGMAAALIFSGLPGTAVSAQEIQMQEVSPKGEGTTADGYSYEEQEDGTLEITGYSGTDTELKIRSTIDSKTVTSIGYYAFFDCDNLSSVEIPSSVTSIKESAFFDCDSLEKITVHEGNKAFSSVDGVLYDKEKTTVICCPGGKTQVSISDGVTSIGVSVFEGCSKLSSIEIPGSVTSIGVTSIGDSALHSCGSLKMITVDGGNKAFSSVDGVLYNKEKTTVICCPRGKTQVSIPDGVTSIGDSAFKYCSSLSSVEIPNSVTELADYAFSGCSSLSSIKLPGSVTSIGWETFSRCTGLSSIELPDSVTSIERRAFYNCGGLTSIKLPSGVRSIGDGTFLNCSSLSSVVIPSSVTSIGLDAFSGCQLKDIYYSGSEEEWGKIQIMSLGEARPTIHYNYGSTSGQQPGNSDPTQQPETPQKSDQTITAQNITKTYGAKPFSINAKANTGTALTYAVSDKKVATVDKKGKVTIKGCGITNITITAPGTDAYNQAKKTIKLTVKPKKVTLSSVKSTKKKTATVKWKQDKKAGGYLIQCATDSKFKKNKVQMTVSKNKTVSATVKKLKAGKKYYVRVCAYAKFGKTKVQGDWSKVKTVKVKK